MGLDQLDVLVLQTLSIDLLVIVIVVLLGLLLLLLTSLDGLAGLAVAVVVTSVVVLATSLGELCGSGLLSGRVQVLNLGLTEDARNC